MSFRKNLLLIITTDLIWLTTVTMAQTAQLLSIDDYGATANDNIDDTEAIEAALTAGKEIFIPEGNYIAEINITSSKTVIRSFGTIKARKGAKHILNIKPSSGWLTDCIIEGGTLDMDGMEDSNISSALFLSFTWGNHIANLRVINQPPNASAIWLEDSVYTSLFDNLDVGSTTGRITLHGKNYTNQAVTTCTFTSCAFGQACLSDVDSITFVSPIVQGTLDKFVMNNVSNVSIYSGDIEGEGVYLKIGVNVNNIYSIGNSLSGFSGNYRQGLIQYRYVLMDDYSGSNNTFAVFDGSSTWAEHSFSICGAGSGQNPKLYVQNPPGHNTVWLADFNNLQNDIGNNGLRINILNKDSKIISFCAANNEVASIDGRGNFNLIGDLNLTGRIKTNFMSGNGFDGNWLSSYGYGQNCILDTVPASLDFSLADPCIIIPSVGSWLIMFNAVIDCNKVSFSSRDSREVKLYLYRFNNNPCYIDLDKAVACVRLPVLTKYSGTISNISCQYIYHTPRSDDIIQIYGFISSKPRKGTVSVSSTHLIALKLN